MRPRFQKGNEGTRAVDAPRQFLLRDAGLLARFAEELGERLGKMGYLVHGVNLLATIS